MNLELLCHLSRGSTVDVPGNCRTDIGTWNIPQSPSSCCWDQLFPTTKGGLTLSYSTRIFSLFHCGSSVFQFLEHVVKTDANGTFDKDARLAHPLIGPRYRRALEHWNIVEPIFSSPLNAWVPGGNSSISTCSTLRRACASSIIELVWRPWNLNSCSTAKFISLSNLDKSIEKWQDRLFTSFFFPGRSKLFQVVVLVPLDEIM